MQITLKSGKVIFYEYAIASEKGVMIHPETYMTQVERVEFKKEMSYEHDVVHIYF